MTRLPNFLRRFRPLGVLIFCLVVQIGAGELRAQNTITSNGNGMWSSALTWVGGVIPSATDHVVLNHRVQLSAASTTVVNITINNDGELQMGSRPINISGSLLIAGAGKITGSGVITFTAGSGSVTIPGSLAHTGSMIFNSNRTITSTTNFPKTSGNITIGSGITVTNLGTITLGGSLIGTSSTSTWVNGPNSRLEIQGALLATGSLDASATGNTVEYTSTATVRDLVAGVYYNLETSGSGTKLIPTGATIVIGGDLISNSAVIGNQGSTVRFTGSASSITGSAESSFYNLEIGSGATLMAPPTSTVRGNFTNNGTFNHNGGTLVFDGASASTLSGNPITLTNLTIANPVGVTNSAAISLLGVLTVESACTFVTNSGGVGSLTLISTADNPASDASIGPLLDGAVVSGNVTVQRYVSGMRGIYRYLSSPVSDATVASWIDDFEITGAFTGASKGNVCGYTLNSKSPSMYYYDESRGGLDADRYVAFPQSANGESLGSPLVPGRGYAAYIRRCAPLQIDVTGSINYGDIELPLTYTPTGNTGDGMNLVGNPYPSAIDWSHPDWLRSGNISVFAAIRDNVSGSFQYLDAFDVDQIIAQGQAFWVTVVDDSEFPFLMISETVKTSNSGAFFRQRPVASGEVFIRLEGAGKSDETRARLVADSKSAFDIFDAAKMNNDHFDLFTFSSDNHRLAVNSLPALQCSEPIRLGMRNVKAGSYTITVQPQGEMAGLKYRLQDAYKNTSVLLSDLSYKFDVDSNPASYDVNRFTLHIEEEVLPANVQFTLPEVVCSSTAEIELITERGTLYEIVNENGEMLTSLEGTGRTVNYTISADNLKKGTQSFVVRAKTLCGSLRGEESKSLVVSTPPSEWEAISGQVCGAGNVTLKVIGTSDTDRVIWYEYPGSSSPLYEGAEYVTEHIGKSETFYVGVENSFGCKSDLKPIHATVKHAEELVITQTGNVLTTDSRFTVWYFENTEIGSGEKVIADQTGTYTAAVENGGCISRAEISLIIAATELRETGNGLSIYPNPATERVTIQIGSDEKFLSVELLDLFGRRIQVPVEDLTPRKKSLNVERLSPGTYLIQVHTNRKIQTSKLAKE